MAVTCDISVRGCRSRGISRQPKLTTTSPIAVSASPTGAKSNILNGAPSVCWRTSLTMMLVEVPTSVTSPPSSDMNAIGISSAETELSFSRPSRVATGISVASAPTFLVTIANTAVMPASTGTCETGRLKRAASGRTSGSITPERLIAALITSAEAMMMTTSLVKPVKASFGFTSPTSTASASTPSDTRS